MSSEESLTLNTTDPRPPDQAADAAAESNSCPNCAAHMPREMRFCRHCGYRRGEGVEDYTATQILPGQPAAQTSGLREGSNGNQPRVAFKDAHGENAQTATQYAKQQQQWTANAGFPGVAPSAGGMIQPIQPQQPFAPNMSGFSTNQLQGYETRRKKKMPWLVWLIIIITFLSIGGGAFSAMMGTRDGSDTRQNAPVSHLGVSDFDDADGNAGAMLDVVTPGSPADKAGLIGGDIITRFNGQPVKNADDINELRETTPVGSTVTLEYLRDGEARQTQLVTISSTEWVRTRDAFNRRKDKGFFGVSSFDRVFIPQLKIFGVQLNDISKNRPADMSGLKEGDIVIEFEGVPIRTEEEFVARIERSTPYSTVKVTVVRNGEKVEVPVKVGIDD